MSEIKIARFVGIEACKSIFSEKSTFVLRSPEHYRRLYETNEAKGDRDEGCADNTNGGTSEYTSWVASCWTKLKGSEPTSDEWDIFKENDQNIVAIVSSPSKVCEFLSKTLETNKERAECGLSFYPVQHGEVNYGKKEHIDHTNITKLVPFWKKAPFSKEKEYRFVLEYSCPHLIDSFIFYGGLGYMETCFANPVMCKKQKEKLQFVIMTSIAGYGDFSDKDMGEIIANADDIFCPRGV